MTAASERPAAGYPSWVPVAARHYVAHTEQGRSIRQLAREAEVHASTVLRQIRRTETRRDDPLVDDALRALALTRGKRQQEQGQPMTRSSRGETRPPMALPSGDALDRHGLRILRRLSEAGVVLAVARDMEMGVVVRDGADGVPQRVAVVEREIAQAMALKDWIAAADPTARIVRYKITGAGRQALKDLAQAEGAEGFADAAVPFRGAPRGEPVESDMLLRHARSGLGESPLVALSRRRDRSGNYFLPRELVAAGERLREDYELARMGPARDADWGRAVLEGPEALPDGQGGPPASVEAARRVALALGELGAGLGDVALRCCCLLEGLESLEQSMHWSARSGKIVLRIALDRLRRHYRETEGKHGPLIG